MEKLERIARDLGKELQKDERYIAFMNARAENEKDNELNELIGRVQLIHLNYGREAEKGDDADQDKLDNYEKEFNEAFTVVRNHPKMIKFESARDELDRLMKYLTGILSMCACGDDPESCDPEASQCSGDCSSCGGCN